MADVRKKLSDAAPALAEALRGVLEAFEWHGSAADFCPTGMGGETIAHIISAALLKAGLSPTNQWQPQGGASFEGHDAEGLAVYSNVALG